MYNVVEVERSLIFVGALLQLRLRYDGYRSVCPVIYKGIRVRTHTAEMIPMSTTSQGDRLRGVMCPSGRLQLIMRTYSLASTSCSTADDVHIYMGCGIKYDLKLFAVTYVDLLCDAY